MADRATVADRVNATTDSSLRTTTLIGTSSLTFDGTLASNPSINYVAGGGIGGGLRIKGGGSTATNGKIVMEAPQGVTFTSKLDISGDLAGSKIGAKLLLYGGERYSMGVQAHTLYFRTASDFSFHQGGVHADAQNSPGGTGGSTGTELVRFTSTNAQFPKTILLRDGTNNAEFTFDHPTSKVTLKKAFETTGAITAPKLSFGSTMGQHINLWGTEHGVGFQDYTTYLRTSRNFVFYKGGVHNDAEYSAGSGGQELLRINGTDNKIAGGLGITTGVLNFNNRYGQLINLWRFDADFPSSSGGLGIQRNTVYVRTPSAFSVYEGGDHRDGNGDSGGGHELLRLDGYNNRMAGDLRLRGNLNIRGAMSVGNTDGLKGAHFEILDRSQDSRGPNGTFMRITGTNLINSSGAIYYDGDSNWDYRSDRRLKKNIVSAEPVLDRLLQVRMVRYNWKAQQDGDKQHFGVIAQEIEPLFPDFINYREKLGDDPDPIRTVALSDFGLLATAALQEFHKEQAEENQNLRAQNASLEDRVASLEDRVASQDDRVAKLEAALEALLAR